MPHLPPLHPHPPNTRSHTASRFTRNLSFNSGIIKTTDGGVHWERKSKGMWDTRVNGVWVHPDDKTGNHVFAGTHSGVYESTDGAENWELAVETAGWGTVMSFLPGMIGGKPYIIANNQNGILTKPSEGGKWQKIIAPGGIAGNAHISLVLNQEKTETEVLTCIGGWGGGQLYYAHLDSPTNATWEWSAGCRRSNNGVCVRCCLSTSQSLPRHTSAVTRTSSRHRLTHSHHTQHNTTAHARTCPGH